MSSHSVLQGNVNLSEAAATMPVYGFHQQLEVEMCRHLPHVHTLSVAVDTHMRLKKLEA